MKVKDLIQLLQTFPEDLEVVCSPNGYDSENYCPVKKAEAGMMVIIDNGYFAADDFVEGEDNDKPRIDVVILENR